MHKEIKRGNKTIAIIISLLTVTVALYIHEFSRITFGKNATKGLWLEVILGVLTLIVVIKETKKCKMHISISLYQTSL